VAQRRFPFKTNHRRFNVEQFRKERRESFNGRGELRAPASVDREIQLLSRIFSLAVERGLIQTNPCKGVKLSSVGRIVTRYLTSEEEDRLLAVLASPRRERLRNVLLIGLHTGLRRTEILTLHKSQVDLARNIIELQAHQTKGKKFRAVPISETLRPLLVELCANVSASGYLFENPKTGKPITDIKKGWAAALRNAGIAHIRFHDIRHTFGTRAVDGGAPLSAVKDVMGHADIRTTMRYIHATDEGKRKAVEAAAKVRVSAPASHLPHKKRATG
jgi:integrase